MMLKKLQYCSCWHDNFTVTFQWLWLLNFPEAYSKKVIKPIKIRAGLKLLITAVISYLVGGFNPSEKYARQIGCFPQVGVKICENEKMLETITKL